MENMTQKAVQMGVVDEIKVDVDEIKVAAEMGVAANEPDVLASSGRFRYIDADEYVRRLYANIDFGSQGEFGRSRWKFIRAEPVKDYIDLEIGVKTEEVVSEYWRKNEWGEVVSECWWKNKCPKYVGYANGHIERIVKELKDEGTALKFIPVEMFKGLKDEGYGLKCIPIETVKELKDDGYGLKFIPVDTVKMLKDDDCALKFIPAVMVKELKEDGYALFIPAEIVEKFKDEYNIKMESTGVKKAVVDECWWMKKCIECVGYANAYIEKTVKPEMGLLFSGATMQNIYQLVTSGMVTTGKGKTLLKLNETAFMMLLYGLVMPRRAAGHVALAIGVALASAAYLVTMSFAF